MEKKKICTFNIMFLPSLKYPAASTVGHWCFIWAVIFVTCLSSLADPSIVEIWQIVMYGSRAWKSYNLYLDTRTNWICKPPPLTVAHTKEYRSETNQVIWKNCIKLFFKVSNFVQIWLTISTWWFSVGICKYKPGYKSHDLL